MRYDKRLYLIAVDDKYELPLMVGTRREVASYLNCSESNVSKLVKSNATRYIGKQGCKVYMIDETTRE